MSEVWNAGEGDLPAEALGWVFYMFPGGGQAVPQQTKLGESSAESPFIVEALQYMPFLSNNALLTSRAFGIVVVEQREVNRRAPNTRAR